MAEQESRILREVTDILTTRGFIDRTVEANKQTGLHCVRVFAVEDLNDMRCGVYHCDDDEELIDLLLGEIEGKRVKILHGHKAGESGMIEDIMLMDSTPIGETILGYCVAFQGATVYSIYQRDQFSFV